jgi:hypothetical protein
MLAARLFGGRISVAVAGRGIGLSLKVWCFDEKTLTFYRNGF